MRKLWLIPAWLTFIAFCVFCGWAFDGPPSAPRFWSFVAAIGTAWPLIGFFWAKAIGLKSDEW